MNIDLEITPAEWQIMRVVWSLRQTTSSQIIEILQKKVDWKPAKERRKPYGITRRI